ncbi:ABC transporter permease [Pantoea vagans]|uniref:ABC transporter permease n=1 Tax=Pantoea vagans TaxID=470934 RepID=UPI003015F22B
MTALLTTKTSRKLTLTGSQSEHRHVLHNSWSYWKGWKVLGGYSLWVLLALIYFPLVWLGLMSFSARPLSGIPFPFTFEHYDALFANSSWVQPFGISVLIGVAVGIVTAFTATVVGRAIPHSPRSGMLVLLAMLPLFIPGMSMGAAQFIFLRPMLGMTLGFWSIFLGHVVWAFPFSLLIVLVLTTRFDSSLIEAAADLGASRWQTFWQIEMPILRPGIVGAALFGFLISFNEAQRSIFLRGTSTTMPIWNWTMASSQQSQVPIIFSLETIVLLVVLPLLAAVFWVLFARMDKN